jgi:hypothetical protein
MGKDGVRQVACGLTQFARPTSSEANRISWPGHAHARTIAVMALHGIAPRLLQSVSHQCQAERVEVPRLLVAVVVHRVGQGDDGRGEPGAKSFSRPSAVRALKPLPPLDPTVPRATVAILRPRRQHHRPERVSDDVSEEASLWHGKSGRKTAQGACSIDRVSACRPQVGADCRPWPVLWHGCPIGNGFRNPDRLQPGHIF